MIVKFNQLVTILSESGALSMAFDSLSIVIGTVIAVFGGLVLAGTYVFTSLALMARVISTIFVGAWNLAVAAFSRGKAAVVAIARGLPGAITSALANLPSKLWSLGAAAMRGLYNGLVNGAKAVLNKAAEIAGNIASTIAGALHIKSPSRVMMEIGGHITDGLALGIAGGESDVVRSMQSLSGAVAGGIDGSLGLDTAGTPGAGSLPVDLSASSIDRLADAILAGASRVANGLDDRRDFTNSVKSRVPGAFAGSLV